MKQHRGTEHNERPAVIFLVCVVLMKRTYKLGERETGMEALVYNIGAKSGAPPINASCSVPLDHLNI